jgi:hypothetical protein
MKEILKKMLDDDEKCAEKLNELKKRGVSYDKLWNDVLYSDVSIYLYQLTFNFSVVIFNIYLLSHSYLEKIVLKKDITSAVLRKLYGQHSESTESNPSTKTTREKK